MNAEKENEKEPIIVYGHPACPMVPPVLGILKSASVPHKYINIRNDRDAAAVVRQINDGFESVPTLIFPDQSTLTEPTTHELTTKLKAIGYTPGLGAWIVGNMGLIVGSALVLYAILRFIGIL